MPKALSAKQKLEMKSVPKWSYFKPTNLPLMIDQDAQTLHCLKSIHTDNPSTFTIID